MEQSQVMKEGWNGIENQFKADHKCTKLSINYSSNAILFNTASGQTETGVMHVMYVIATGVKVRLKVNHINNETTKIQRPIYHKGELCYII